MDALVLRCGDSTVWLPIDGDGTGQQRPVTGDGSGPLAVLNGAVPGAAIGGWHWRGVALLYAGAGELACFPLVPYANRIAHGRLPGEPALPPHPGEAHSLHGVGWRRPWHIVAHDAGHHAVLGLQHRADADWPFDFAATLTIALGDNWLGQTLAVTNTGARNMPLGLGFHPSFPAGAGTTLDAGWSGRWDVSADHLPLGTAPVAVAAGPVAVGPWQVNHCYTGWQGEAVLGYPGYALTVSAGPLCRFLQCYRPGADSGFVAVEPVTHVPNAHRLRADGVAGTGLHDLAPGAALSTAMTLRVAAV